MNVKVFHDGVAVARFTFNEAESIEDALELAYMHTNNINDSWSLAGSQDSHPSLELLEPRPVIDGREYGHRSSMMGDRFEVSNIDGADGVQTYKCAMFGFDRVD